MLVQLVRHIHRRFRSKTIGFRMFLKSIHLPLCKLAYKLSRFTSFKSELQCVQKFNIAPFPLNPVRMNVDEFVPSIVPVGKPKEMAFVINAKLLEPVFYLLKVFLFVGFQVVIVESIYGVFGIFRNATFLK